MLDTNVAIHFRDGIGVVLDRLAALRSDPFLSVVTQVELESGVYIDGINVQARQDRLNQVLAVMSVLPFRKAEAAAYGKIVAQIGFSRPRVLDRMIAAQAIVAQSTLITMNGADFRDIAGLKLEVWPSP